MITKRDQLLERLRGDSPEVRRQAVLEAGGLPAGEAVDIVLPALGDDDWRVRKEAALLASRISDAVDMADRLFDATCAEDNIGLRNAAIEALSNAGERTLDRIIDRAFATSPDERRTVSEILGASADPRAEDVLIAALRDGDANVRACAAEWLGDYPGRRTADALTACLKRGDLLLSLVALQSLRKMDASVPWSILEPLEGEKILGGELILAFGRSGATEAVSHVASRVAKEPAACLAMERLHQSGSKVAREVEAALGNLDESGYDMLWQLTVDDDPKYKVAAARCLLWSRKQEHMHRIVKLARNSSLYSALLEELREWGDPATDALVGLLGAVEGVELASTIGLLTRLLSDDRGSQIADTFATLLSSDHASVSTAAAGAVARFGDQSVIPRLFDLTDSPSRRVRNAAGKALADVARRYPEDVLGVIENVEIAGGRGVELCRALRVVGLRDAATKLVSALNDPYPELRKAALGTLAMLDGENAIDPIVASMADEELGVRLAAVDALVAVGQPARETIAAALETAEGPLASALIRAMGKVGHPCAADILGEMSRKSADIAAATIEAAQALNIHLQSWQDEILEHSDTEVVKRALVAFENDISIERLIALLDHSHWDLRLAAVKQLEKKSLDLDTVESLTERIETEPDDLVRDALGRTIFAFRHRGSS